MRSGEKSAFHIAAQHRVITQKSCVTLRRDSSFDDA